MNGEWISVKDKLPEENQEVLVFGLRDSNGEHFMESCCLFHGLWTQLNVGKVTHWRPLLLSPNQEQKQMNIS